MIKAVISDLDGVLVNSEVIKASFWNEILSPYGVKDGTEWYAKNKGTPGPELARRAVKEYALNVDPVVLAQRNRELHLTKLSDAPSIPETVDFLKRLSCKVAVASSMYSSLISFFVNKLGLEKQVSVTVSGADDVPNDKPAPDIYLLAAKRLGVAPQDCVVIEDSLAGVKAAKAAGMICVGYTPMNNYLPADHLVSNFSNHTLETLVDCIERSRLP